MKNRNIELHIEEIVVQGFSKFDRDAFNRALQSRLRLQFAEKGIPEKLGRPHRIDNLSGRTALDRDSTANGVAAGVARLIYGKLGE